MFAQALAANYLMTICSTSLALAPLLLAESDTIKASPLDLRTMKKYAEEMVTFLLRLG